MSHGSAQVRVPRDLRLKEGWRAAAAAYRKAYGEHTDPHRGPAHEAMTAASAALKEVVPELSDREVMLEAVAAVHYASVNHPKWLYGLWKSPPRK
jgi:hypothetical protein